MKNQQEMEINLKDLDQIKILHTEDIYYIMQKVLERESKLDKGKRHFWGIGLDIRSKIILIELVSLGTMAKKDLHASDVYANAIHKQAKQMILCHNNPDGSLQASEEAKDLTDWLIQIGLIVNIPVYDHLIMNERSFVSFREMGLLAELERRTREEEQKKAAVNMEYREKELQEEMYDKLQQNRLDIALAMKEKGYPINDISSMTGLTEQEIKQL